MCLYCLMQNISLTAGLIKGFKYLLYVLCSKWIYIGPLGQVTLPCSHMMCYILWPVATTKWNIHIGQASPNTARRSGCGEAQGVGGSWCWFEWLMSLSCPRVCMCKSKVTNISSFVIFQMLWPLPIMKYGSIWLWITSLRLFKAVPSGHNELWRYMAAKVVISWSPGGILVILCKAL